MGPKYSSKDELQPGIALLGHIQLVIYVSAPLRSFPKIFSIFNIFNIIPAERSTGETESRGCGRTGYFDQVSLYFCSDQD